MYIAGGMTLLGAGLSYLHSVYWLGLTAFVGVNLVVFSATGFCLMANMLYALGARPACGRDGS